MPMRRQQDDAAMKPRSVRVEIDELVLHGVDPRQRYRIADALQAELSRLLAATTPEAAPRAAVARVDAGSFAVAAAADAASIGQGAARALHRSIT